MYSYGNDKFLVLKYPDGKNLFVDAVIQVMVNDLYGSDIDCIEADDCVELGSLSERELVSVLKEAFYYFLRRHQVTGFAYLFGRNNWDIIQYPSQLIDIMLEVKNATNLREMLTEFLVKNYVR